MHFRGEIDVDESAGPGSPAIARLAEATAFAISGDLALTAFHVVGDKENERLKGERWELRFSVGEPVWASVEAFNAKADVAVLRLDKPGLPHRLKPFTLSSAVRRSQHWYAYGFPAVLRDPHTVHGTVVDPHAIVDGAPAIQLHCRQATARSALPLAGFSGSPVIDEDSGAVIGVIRHQLVHHNAPGIALGGDIYAASSDQILGLWRGLLGPLVRRQRAERRAGLGALLLHPLSPDGELPAVRDVGAHDVGATRTRHSEVGSAPYLPRAGVDTDLRNRVRREHFVLVVGQSKAGKSRTAFEAISHELPGARFVHPRPQAQALRRLMVLDLDEPLCPGPLVVWLDELDAYLREPAGLDPAVIEWIGQRESGGLIIGTIRTDIYNERREATGETGKLSRLVLDRAERGRVDLRRNLRPEEVERAKVLYPDEDFSAATVSIGEQLVAAPELLHRLRDAEDNDPYGWATVKAAVDYARMGLPSPVPGRALRRLFAIVVRDRFAGLEPTGAAYRQGLAWACRPGYSHVALLTPSQGALTGGAGQQFTRRHWPGPRPGLPPEHRRQESFTLLDYIEETARREGWPVPEEAWSFAISQAGGSALIAIGDEAADAFGRGDIARKAYLKAAQTGNAAAVLRLGAALAEAGDFAAAKRWLDVAVSAGEPDALNAMGAVSAMSGDLGEAESWLWRAIEAGSSLAPVNMGELCRRHDRPQEAVYWHRCAAEEGVTASWLVLAELYRSRGDTEATRTCLERGADGEEPVAALCKAELAQDADDVEGVERWLRRAAEFGDAEAARRVGILLADRGDDDEAESWLRLAAGREVSAVHDLGVYLHRADRPEEAEACYRRAIAQGIALSAVCLAELLIGQGDLAGAREWFRHGAAKAGEADPDMIGSVAVALAAASQQGDLDTEAEGWLEASAAAGYAPAAFALGKRAFDDHDRDRARRWYLQAALAGDPAAASNLGLLLEIANDVDRAERWYRHAARLYESLGVDEPKIAANLGRVCRARGDLAEAERWLRQAAQSGNTQDTDDHAAVLAELRELQEHNQQTRAHAEGGDADAAYRLAMTCAHRGQDEEAERWFRRAALTGHWKAATALAELLLSAGRAEEAVTWCRPGAEAGDDDAAWLLVVALANTNNTAEAKELATRRAEAGDVGFMTLLGALLADDQPEQAAKWWRRAADSGDADAAEALAAPAEERGDSDSARRWHHQAAEGGNPAGAYHHAINLRADGCADEALVWLRRAAEGGHADAAVELAELIADQDPLEAGYWRQAAAEAGHPVALRSLGAASLAEGEAARAEAYFREAAESGDPAAANVIGALLQQRGENDQAMAWFRTALDRGFAAAAHNLGILCATSGDAAGAMTWWTRAAEAGVSEAMRPLGERLAAEQRNAEAVEWLSRAVAAGDASAAVNLALIKLGEGDRAEALRLAEVAADRAHPGAAFLLGVMMQEDGNGQEADRWFRVAAERGHTEAAFRGAVLSAERGNLRQAERMLALACDGGDAEAAYSLGDLAWRRGWMSASEAWCKVAAGNGHRFAALDVAAMAAMRGAADDSAEWIRQWQAGGTQSAISMAHEDPREIHVTVIRSPTWGPAQQPTYTLSTRIFQFHISVHSERANLGTFTETDASVSDMDGSADPPGMPDHAGQTLEGQGLPAAYGIKVENGHVLAKGLVRYQVIGPLAGSHAEVMDYLAPLYQLIIMLSTGVPYMYTLGRDADAIRQARAWADRFNQLASQSLHDEPQIPQ